MKRYTVKVLCKGCQNEITLGFIAPKAFCDRAFDATCSKCLSQLKIEIRQGQMKKQLMTRVQMVKHTDKLLKILKRLEQKKKITSFFKGLVH